MPDPVLVADGVGGDLKVPVFRPLLITTADLVAGDVGTTETLTVGAPSIISTIDTIGDQDFYRVELVEGRVYEFGMYGHAGGPSLVPLSDAYLEIYDADGQLVTSADGGATTTLNAVNSGFDVLMTFTATSSGTYYVNARAFDNIAQDGTDGDLVGDYELFANDVTDQPHYTPFYAPDSPLYAIDWGTQVNRVHETYRNPDGDEGVRDTGNAPSAVDPGAALGHPGKNVITIYFAQAGDVFVSNDLTNPGLPPATITATGVQDFEHDAVMTALGEFSEVADVVYVEVGDRDQADFIYTSYLGTPGPGVSLLGSMSPPDESDEGLAQFNSGDYRWNATDLQQGGFSFVTLIHEFGHGHGLAHPHDNGGHSGIMNGVASDGVVADYTTGDFDLNQGVFTMMSYEDGWQTSPYGNAPTDVGYGYLGGLMAFDIAAIQDKYGVNEEWATGDNVYELADVNAAGTFYQSIWDAGGTDTIQYSGARDAHIDLRPATLQYEAGGGGWVSYAYGIYGGYTVASGVTIENANGGSGNDVLIGNAADNSLRGADGDDRIDGGAGADILSGGWNTDTADYANSTAGVDVDLTRTLQIGGDAQGDMLTSIENVSGSALADRLTGDAGDNRLYGVAGDDIFAGGDGIDRLYGGTGDDLYYYDGSDLISEEASEGNDTMATSVSATLAANVEYLLMAGTDAISGVGSAVDNVLRGNDAGNALYGMAGDDGIWGGGGDDILNGGAGLDYLAGGSGDDFYYCDSSDIVVEEADGGFDTVSTGVDITLAANLEWLLMSGSGNIAGTGNALDNGLLGNDGANMLSGGAGDDGLWGYGGADTLIGGAGLDALTGGAGADTFRFDALSDSTTLRLDHILDFSTAEGDRIDLSAIDADSGSGGDQAFAFIGGAAFGSIAGQLRFADGALSGDVDGDGMADFAISVATVSLASSDFVL